MFLGGAPIPAHDVRALATILKDAQLAERLEQSVERDAIVIRLDEDERAVILKALTEPPPELEGVRDALSGQSPASRGASRLAADNVA